jgi:Bifunctional DNA primase/polymerase, N-terminal
MSKSRSTISGPRAPWDKEAATEINLRVALHLAQSGLRIFPARPARKASGGWNKPPYISSWRSLATTGSIQINHWWEDYPDAIPAIPCRDFVVLDADRHAGGSDGVAALARLIEGHGEWPFPPVVLTPGGGLHFYFQQTDPPLGNRTGTLPDGLDVRGAGGYVIGPGAVLPDGTCWRIDNSQPDELPRLPKWLERLICADKIEKVGGVGVSGASVTVREKRYAETALEGAAHEVEIAPTGKRNKILNSVSYRLGRMVGAGWIERNFVAARLLSAAINLTREDGEAAVKATIQSGLKAGQRQPHPDLPDRGW